VARDDYYYEIQLTNKQLVFYFMAGATGLILSFLAGVMVGRGVDAAGEVQAARAPVEERVVEETPVPAPPAPAEDLTYAQRLESEKPDDRLERPAAKTAAADTPSRSTPFPARAPAADRAPAGPKPSTAAASASAAGPVGSGQFTIQVGAFKDGAAAETIVSRLKDKGFAAYVVPPGGADGYFNVRVGAYKDRAEAEKVQSRLVLEKFKPFIVRR
jgi:cell division septation protein DedD